MEKRDALEALGALAQQSRLDVFRLLVRAGPEGLPAGEIAKKLGVPPSTMSAHLALLTRARLIAARRESRVIFYGVETDGVRALFDFLAADCCGGKPELCAPLTEFGKAPACKPAAKRKALQRRG